MAENKVKFSAGKLKSLLSKPHPERVEYWDAGFPGLCLRIGPRAASWYYFRRIDGKLSRLHLGGDAELAMVGEPQRSASFTVARAKANEIETALAAGRHPKAEQARERAEKREARQQDHERLVRKVADNWQRHHLPKVSEATRADYARALGELVEAYGDDDIGKIKRGQLVRFLDGIAARSPSAANRAAVVVRQLFAFAADRHDLPANPAADIKNPAKQRIRKRQLSRDEVRVLWRACELAGYPWGHALRFALCTAQRIGEVGNIRRSDVAGDYWIQAENKTDKRIDIYLSEHARAILADCPDFGKRAPYFTIDGDKGIHPDRWNKAIPRHIAPRIAEAAEALGLDPITEHWTPHDLRRTVRTGLTGWCVGVSPDDAERVLNHSIGGLRAVYDHADYKPHVTDALAAWDQELTRILDGAPSARDAAAESKRGTKRRRAA